MKKYKIYHNPRCSKSRQTLHLIKDKGIDPIIIEYLKTPLDKKSLRVLSGFLSLRPSEFVRKGEADFKENELSRYLDNDDKILEAMALFPKIIERPIVTCGNRAIIGRPPSNVEKLFS